ncbi:MAG: YHYH protein [Planctomycetales bacterium]
MYRKLRTLFAVAGLLAVALVVGCYVSPNLDGAPAYKNSVQITTDENYRTILSNGIPDHPPASSPNPHNPNSIRPQNYKFRVPLHPKPANKPTPLAMQDFGVAINGVPFDPFAAEWWRRDRSSGWQYEPMSAALGLKVADLGLDQNNAHVQPTGAYHYHSIPLGLIDRLNGKNKMTLIGYAADGFPIYNNLAPHDPKDPDSRLVTLHSSYKVKSGTRPDGPGGKYDGSFVRDYEYVAGAGDLDECNGRTGVTPEYPDGTYYYAITAEFPYIPRYYRGTPDSSFRRGPPGGGPPPGGPGGPGGRRPPRRPPPRY